MGYRYSDTMGHYADFRVDEKFAKMFIDTKLRKHIKTQNVDKLIAYVIGSFQHWNPHDRKNHPCRPLLNEAVEILKSKHYDVKAIDCTATMGKDYGFQIIVYCPDKKGFYHSSYKEDWSKTMPPNQEMPLIAQIIDNMMD